MKTHRDVFISLVGELRAATVEDVQLLASERYGFDRESIRKRKRELINSGRIVVVGKRQGKEVLAVSGTMDGRPEANSALTPSEKAELDQCEAAVVEHLRSFVIVGENLARIRDNRLHRETHSDFGAYCRERYGITRSRSYQLIDAYAVSGIVKKVSTVVDTLSERQLRPLAKLRDPSGCIDAESVELVWSEVISEAPKDESGVPQFAAKDVEAKVREFLRVDELAGVDDEEEEPMEEVSLAEALRAASRCKSVDADYLHKKTGIQKSKIQAWLELSGEASSFKAVRLSDKTYAIHRQRIKSDAQAVKEVKRYSLHGESTPEEHLASDLDSITNKIEGVISLYSPGCKDFSAWHRLSADDKKNLRFLLTSAMAKVEKQFPYFLGLIPE